MASTERGFGQPTASFAANRNRPCQLPTPIISSVQDLPAGITEAIRSTYSRPLSPADVLSRRPAPGFGQPEPSPKLISPSLLDPSLMEGTVYAAIRDYYTKRAEIEKLYSENELQFEQFQVKYGLHLGPGHPSTLQPGSVPPHLGQAYNSQQRIESAHQHLPSYQAPSLYESLGSADDRTVEKESRGPTPYRYASPPGQNGLGIYEDRGDEPVELALSSPSREPDKDCQMPLLPQPGSRTTNKAGTPTKQTKLRKGTPQDGPATRYAREKKPSWYASHLENADLPTSTLSSSAIHAGLAYDPKASPTHKANETNLVKPKKKRRRMGDEVPMPECMVPPEKIRALYANGCPMKYIGEGPNPYLTEAGAVEEQDRS